MSLKNFQLRVTSGHFTLPAAILISLCCWLLAALLQPNVSTDATPLFHSSTDASLALTDRLGSFLLYAVIGYFLVEINNRFAIIRMRASVQTSIYSLLAAVCPGMHLRYAGDVASAALLVALFFLFDSYQHPYPAGRLFHSFVFLGVASLFLPQFVWLVPFCWIGAYNFRSLTPRSFLASLLGFALPYWFLLCYAYWTGQMDIFYSPLSQMLDFRTPAFSFLPWELAMLLYLLLLYVVSAAHCLATGFSDKLRTRSYLHFLLLVNGLLFLLAFLQAWLCIQILPLLLIGVSLLSGHLFALSGGKAANIFFVVSLLLLLLLFVFNLWIFL